MSNPTDRERVEPVMSRPALQAWAVRNRTQGDRDVALAVMALMQDVAAHERTIAALQLVAKIASATLREVAVEVRHPQQMLEVAAELEKALKETP